MDYNDFMYIGLSVSANIIPPREILGGIFCFLYPSLSYTDRLLGLTRVLKSCIMVYQAGGSSVGCTRKEKTMENNNFEDGSMVVDSVVSVSKVVSVVEEDGIKYLLLPTGVKMPIPDSNSVRVRPSEFRGLLERVELNIRRLGSFQNNNPTCRSGFVYDNLSSDLRNSSEQLRQSYCTTISDDLKDKSRKLLELSDSMLDL